MYNKYMLNKITGWVNILNNVSMECQHGDFPYIVKYMILELKREVCTRKVNLESNCL